MASVAWKLSTSQLGPGPALPAPCPFLTPLLVLPEMPEPPQLSLGGSFALGE